MKLTMVLLFGFLTTFAHANMSIDGGTKLYLSEIECLESLPEKTEIVCKDLSGMMFCSTLFDVRLNNGGIKSVQLYTTADIACDSKLWRNLTLGLTDKINAATARSEAKIELRSLISQVKKIKSCH
ncbi:MAG: hypothetical protein NDI69_03335 [Bacteriovoracaceae bacterium]|nr:hypothetical protein [Bacteriovoracaceae bacterium]